MGSIYDAQSTIPLPRMTGGSAASLGAQLKAAGEAEKKLAPNVADSFADLDAATVTLQAAVHESLAGPPDAVVQPTYHAEAAVWSGAESWLDSFGKLPAGSDAATIAEQLHAALFPDGLGFLRLPALERWNETQRRMDIIASRKATADFTTLGGSEFLSALETTHAATGAAAGITAALPPASETPPVGIALNAFRAALRCYVAQHVANGARDKSGAAAAISTRLLAPLANYAPPARAKAAGRQTLPDVAPVK